MDKLPKHMIPKKIFYFNNFKITGNQGKIDRNEVIELSKKELLMLTTNKIELRDLFIKLGVRKGDTILIHTSLLTLGKLKGGLKTFHNVLLKLVSKKRQYYSSNFYIFIQKK